MLAVPSWLPLSQLALVAVAAVCLYVLWRLDDRRAHRVAALRSRLLYGVPWGTLLSILFVLIVYLVVQGGYDYWYRPVVVPFRAWSYLYPTGMLTAAFTHSGAGHLVGNLVGTLTLAPLVEYAWGHYPKGRTSQSAVESSGWRTDPRVRAFVLFPAAVLVVGVLTALFSVGPIIGFSGVVFAFAGFALVYYPLTTVLALSAGNVVDLVYDSVFSPTTVASSREAFISPWWAQIAIQGHAIGLLTGVLLALWLVERRGDDHPAAFRLWTGVLLYSVSQSMWAVYWYRGGDSYVLFRAAGLALVFLLATLVTAAAAAGDRPLLDRFGAEVRARTGDLRSDGSGRDSSGDTGGENARREGLQSVTGKQAAVALLLVGAAAITGPAIAVNMVTTAGEELPGESVQVRGYEVTYAEDVTNGMVAVVDIEGFGESTSVTTSGVIVRNPGRSIWTRAVSKGRLAFDGRQAVRVGGVGWRETVVANRTGWSLVGSNASYRVTLAVDDNETVAYTSPPATAEPTIAGQNVSIAAEDEQFILLVGPKNDTVSAPVPRTNESVTLRGIQFTNRKGKLYATTENGTRVRVAARERYQ
ncbi:rhomboid family intramembrane serine protease [Haloprofundus marisrubri]|uniref:Rhomboid family intramembrane serine protease n=1 Tax=Haloprofundus marisrubri TaxID=1514971 RepID=A0A0W1R9S7_9EURY|nr:rhomboid family intramembrane serine protease [Haloprofundus marisrubri]KTG10236.1 rhomboid family intramembrane serine protease [Haloprofundus marisrubri]